MMENTSSVRRRSNNSLILSVVLSLFVSVLAMTPASAAPGLVAAYSFDQGSGTAVTDASGNNNTGSTRRDDAVDHRGQVQRGALVQRHQLPRGYPQLVLPAAHQRDDARGLGEPHDRHEQMARRDREGQRQLLPDGDLLPLLHPCGRGDHRRDPRGGLRHRRARDETPSPISRPPTTGRRSSSTPAPPPPTSPSWGPRPPPVPS